MAEKTDGKNKQPGKWRRRLKRSGKVLLVFLGLVVLFLIFLPLILTLLPTDRIVTHYAAPVYPGEIELKGFSIGWFDGIEIGSLELSNGKEGNEASSLVLKRFRTEKGLLSAAFSQSRVGKISLDEFSLTVQRGREGELFLPANLPPATENDPVEESTGNPLVLELKSLLPKIELPLDSLWVELKKFHVGYIDHALAEEVHVNLDPIALKWAGGDTPLVFGVKGTVDRQGYEMPLGFQVVLDDWVKGTQTDFSRSKVTCSFITNGRNTFSGVMAIDGERVDWSSHFSLLNIYEDAVTLCPSIMPDVLKSGVLQINGSVDLSLQETMSTGLEFSLLDIQLGAFGHQGRSVAVPDFVLRADATIRKEDYLPEEISVIFASELFELVMDGRFDSLEDGTVTVEGSYPLLPTIELLDATQFRNEMVPIVDGMVSFQAKANYRDYTPTSADLTFEWKGESLRWRDITFFPPGFPPTGPNVDLKPTSMELSVNLSQNDTGNYQVKGGVKGSLVQSDFSAELTSEYEPVSGELSVNSSLGKVFDYANSLVKNLPVTAVDGDLSVDQSARFDEMLLSFPGKLEVSKFSLESDLLPKKIYKDDLTCQWDGVADLEDATVPEYYLAMESKVLNVESSGEFLTPEDFDTVTTMGLQLALTQEEFIQPYLGEEELVALDGVLFSVLSAGSKKQNEYETALIVYGDSNFLLELPTYEQVIEGIAFYMNCTTSLNEDEIYIDLSKIMFSLDEMMVFEGKSQTSMQGERIVTDGYLKTTMVLDSLSDRMVPFLEQAGLEDFSIEGKIVSGISVRADLTNSVEKGMFLNKPLVTTQTLTLDIPYVYVLGEFGEVEIEEVTDQRTMSVRMDDLTTETLWLKEAGNFSIANVVYDGMFESGTVLFSSEMIVEGMNKIAFTLSEFSLESPVLMTETMELELPKAMMSGVVHSNQESGITTFDDIQLNFPGMLVSSLSGDFDANAMAVNLTPKVEYLGLDEVEFVILDPEGNPIEYSIEGTALLKGDVHLDLNGAADLMNRRGEVLDSDLTLQWDGWNVEWNDQFGVSDVGGFFQFICDKEKMSVGLRNHLGSCLMENQVVPFSENWNLDGSLVVLQNGDVELSRVELASPLLGSTLAMYGSWSDAMDILENQLLEEKSALDLLFDYPWRIIFSCDQDVEKLASLPSVSSGAGSLNLSMGMRHSPVEGLFFETTRKIDSLAIEDGQMMMLNEMTGEGELSLHWPLEDSVSTNQTVLNGNLSIGLLEMIYPMMARIIETGSFETRRAQGEVIVEGKTAGFLGGSGSMEIRMNGLDDRPVIYTEFSATGLDASLVYPELSFLDKDARSFSLFGSCRVPFPEEPVAARLIEDLSFRMDLADIKSDLLIAYLKMLNSESPSPGISTSIAALGVGSPEGITIQMRHGLMDIDLSIKLRIGGIVTIPLIDRLNIAKTITSQMDPEVTDVGLVMMYQFLDLLQTKNTKELHDELEKWSQP